MHRQIPNWYLNAWGTTPYAHFERWRRTWRIGVWAALGAVSLLVLCIVAAGPQRMADWMTAHHMTDSPRGYHTPEDYRRMTKLILLSTAVMYSPLFLGLWLARRQALRRLRRLTGRCLNCGEPRRSEFLDECSRCQSDYREQDLFRDSMLERVRWTRYPSLRKGTPESRRLSTRTALAAGLLLALMIPSGYVLFTSEDTPNRQVTAVEIVCLFTLVLGWVPFMIYFTKWRQATAAANLLRLRGRCLACESVLGDATKTCPTCHSTLLSQVLFVRRLLIRWMGEITTRRRAEEIAADFGIQIKRQSIYARRKPRDTAD